MLEEIRKSLEKQMIRALVASPSYATSQNRKAMTRQTLQQTKQVLKQNSIAYSSQLDSSAKGKWVNAAKKATARVTKKIDELA